MTEQKRTDEVTLSCSVSPYRTCYFTVKWLHMNKDVTEDDTELKTSQSDCSATVSFSKSSSVHKMKNYSSLTCYVDDGHIEETFAFIPPSSGEKTQNTMNCSWSNKFHLLTHLFFLRRKERTSSRKQRNNRYWILAAPLIHLCAAGVDGFNVNNMCKYRKLDWTEN